MGRTIISLLLVFAAASAGFGQSYKAGDIVENFTLIDRATNQPIELRDLEGKIIFLEWFAWWCPFCQAAASQIEPGIVNYYKGRRGNNAGVEVVHVGLNLQGNQEMQTQDFVNAYGFNLVWNDFDRQVANRFQTGGQPIFAIINGVKDSPSHQQWELVYTRLGYGDLMVPISTFRSEIESVAAPSAVTPPIDINQHPLSQTVSPGSLVSLTVEATGNSLSYQWLKDGLPIAGATEPTLTIAGVATGDTGFYSARITDGAIETVSRLAGLEVAPEGVLGQLVNLSVRTLTGVGGQPLILGFSVEGGATELLMRGIGPQLLAFGVESVLANPFLTLFRAGAVVDMNDNWTSLPGGSVVGLFDSVGAFLLLADNLSAVLSGEVAGGHTLHVSDVGRNSGIALAELYDVTRGLSRLVNLSARNAVGTGADILIAGFSISGNQPLKLLIRGVGPTLALPPFGLSGILENPALTVHTTSEGTKADLIVATNDDWGDELNKADIAAAAATEGAFALEEDSRDSALLLTLAPGNYTVHLAGVDESVGEGLIEVYEVD